MGPRLYACWRVALAMAVLVGAWSCKVEVTGGCVIGPCGPPTLTDLPITMVVGIPASTLVNGVVRLQPGDTMSLHYVRFTTGSGCTARDTLRDSIRWGSSDPGVATVTLMPDGRGLLRASANGTFNVLMLRDAYASASTSLPPVYVLACPASGLYKDFRVGP